MESCFGAPAAYGQKETVRESSAQAAPGKNIKDGLKYFERRGDQFEMDNDFDTENAKFKATARYSFGWSDPRALYGSAGA